MPEYHFVFGNEGDYEVVVKTNRKGSSVPARRASANDLLRLIDADSGRFVERMTFDEWPGKIEKIEILPGERRVVIKVALE